MGLNKKRKRPIAKRITFPSVYLWAYMASVIPLGYKKAAFTFAMCICQMKGEKKKQMMNATEQ